MQENFQKENYHQLVNINLAELPIEKTLENLLFVNLDYTDVSKLKKIHNINVKQQSHLLKSLDSILNNTKKLKKGK